MSKINLDEARAFIANADKEARELELKKVRLEQQKEFTEKSLEENRKKMEALGCTPETIGSVIDTKSVEALALRQKIETILQGAKGGVQ